MSLARLHETIPCFYETVSFSDKTIPKQYSVLMTQYLDSRKPQYPVLIKQSYSISMKEYPVLMKQDKYTVSMRQYPAFAEIVFCFDETVSCF